MLQHEHTAIARRRAARVELDAALRSGRAHPATLERLRRCAFDLDTDMAIQPMGGHQQAGSAPVPPNVPNLFAWLISNQESTFTASHAGTGDSISAPVASDQTLTDAAAPFAATDISQRLNIAGSVDPLNNGNFWSVASGGANTLSYRNATGVADLAYAGAWTLPGKYTQLLDLQNSRAFVQATDLQRPARVTEFGGSVLGRPRLLASGLITLIYNDAACAGFQGQNVCISGRFRYLNADGVQACEITDGTSSNRYRLSCNSTTMFVRQDGGGNLTQLQCAYVSPNDTWFTLGGRLNVTGATMTASAFTDGALTSTSASGTSRVTVGLNRASVFSHVTMVAAPAFCAGLALGWGWSDADFLTVHNAFLDYGVPS
jgi:hypothetical protein